MKCDQNTLIVACVCRRYTGLNIDYPKTTEKYPTWGETRFFSPGNRYYATCHVACLFSRV